jgi:hypothetical protein
VRSTLDNRVIRENATTTLDLPLHAPLPPPPAPDIAAVGYSQPE